MTAVARVTTAILEGKTQVIDLDLAAYFDTVRHDLLVSEGGAPCSGCGDPALAHVDAEGIRKARGSSGRCDFPPASATSISLRWMRCWSGPRRSPAMAATTYVEYARVCR